MTTEQWIDLAKRAIDVARVSDDPITRAAGERLHKEELHGNPLGQPRLSTVKETAR